MKKIISLFVLLAAIIITSLFYPLNAPAACDKESAKKTMSMMVPPMVQSITKDAGWIIITFGSDYFSWTDRQTEGIVTAYANVDACISGQARSLEFRSPSGKLVARADRLRGIQMK